MSRGCVVALVAVLGGIGLFFVVAIVVPLIMLDIVVSAPEVPIDNFITGETAAVAVLDPNQSAIRAAFAKQYNSNADGISYLLPYKCGIIVDMVEPNAERRITLMANTRHFGPAVMLLFSDNEVVKAMTEDSDSPGIDRWSAEPFKRHGAIVFRGEGAIAPEVLSERISKWSTTGSQHAHVEGGHFFEFAIANANGQAFAALQPWADELDYGFATEEEETATEDESAAESVDVAEAEPTTDTVEPAESIPQAEAEAPETEAVVVDPICGDLLRTLTSATLTADFKNEDTIAVRLVAQCANAAATEAALKRIEQIQAMLIESFAAENLELVGSLTREGTAVQGDFAVVGLRNLIKNKLEETAGEVQQAQSQS